jgi:hypothetical protein
MRVARFSQPSGLPACDGAMLCGCIHSGLPACDGAMLCGCRHSGLAACDGAMLYGCRRLDSICCLHSLGSSGNIRRIVLLISIFIFLQSRRGKKRL